MNVLIISLFKNSHHKGGIQAFLERLTSWFSKNSATTFTHLAISDFKTYGKGNFSISKAVFHPLNKYDLVFIAGHNVPAIDFIYLRSNMLKIPVIHMPFYHGIETRKRFGFSKLYFKIVFKYVYSFARKFFFVSFSEVQKFYLGSSENDYDFELMDHALASHFVFNPKPDTEKKLDVTVGYVGRPVFSKGYDLYTEIASKNISNFVFKAIGPGLRDQCVSDQDILEFYEECDVIIVPSREESFGLAVIEALALGCVVITSEFVPSTYNLQHIDSLEIIKGDFVENTTSFLENSLTRDQLDANFDARQTLAQKIRGQFSENVVYSRYERSISEALE